VLFATSWFGRLRHDVMATRATRTLAFGAPILVIGGNAGDGFPSLTVDELTIMFESSRSGGGDEDLWMATRTSNTEPFGPPVIVPDLNSNEEDWDPGLSADGGTLVFVSERDSPGDPDNFITTRTCLETN
jgi:Tol biopolymer transport system component